MNCLNGFAPCVDFESTIYKQLFTKGCDYPGQYIPKHLDRVDLALCPGQIRKDPRHCVGIEVKTFANNYSQSFRNVDYFVNGRLSSNGPFNSRGSFLQNGLQTFCKEGQLLSDFCRAVRILSRQSCNYFFLVGTLEYQDVPATDLKIRIEELLARFYCNPILYRHYDRCKKHIHHFMVEARLTSLELDPITTNVDVISLVNKPWAVYCVTVHRQSMC